MRLVSIDMLTSNMSLAFPVYNDQTLVMLPGKNGVDKYRDNFRNMGIGYVYVEDKLSEGIVIPDVLDLQTRTDCKLVLKKVMDYYNETSIFKMVELTAAVDGMIKDILRNKDLLLSLNDYASIDEYTYLHSVNVTVYSLLMGEALGYSIPELRELAIGAMLHDIGKTVMNLEAHEREGTLTDSEFKLMKKHARYGYEILEDVAGLSKRSRDVAWMHHEKLDGTGYPQGLQGEEITEFSQIVCIADVYDALTSDRCYRDKWPAVAAMEYLQERAGGEFSEKIVECLRKKVAVYPNGSLVQLSTKMYGIVMEQSNNFPLQPVVRVCYDKDMREVSPFELDLVQSTFTQIANSELEIDWKNKQMIES